METIKIEKVKKMVPELRFKEFEGEWNINKLSNWNLKVIDGDRGTNYPNGDDFAPEGYCLFMNAKNVTKNGFSFETKMFISKQKDDKLRKGKLKRNDLILTTRGSVGNIAYYDNSIKLDHLRINSGMVIIRNENSQINSQFIYCSFFTPKFNRIIDTISFGSAQPQLTVKEINLFKISLPSLPEQQKIASFLSAVDEKIQQLSRKKELLEQYKKGVMQQLFPSTGSGQRSGKLRFKDENGEEYPEWEEKRLGEVAVFLDGKRKPIKAEDRFKMKGIYPYYGASGIIDFVNDYIFDEELILLGEDGENIISRNLPLAFRVSGKCWVNNHAHVIKPINNNNIDFLTFSLERINYSVYNTGTAQPKLNQEVCRNIPLTMPSLPEQQKIANFLSTIDTKIESTSQQINQSQSFKKGLLQKMFV